MHLFGLTSLLFTVIVLEGYIVLSTELLAIRQTIPFVGSGTDTVSIIIAAVLMPLAFGYHAGGAFKPGFHNGQFINIRRKLIKNMLISQAILLCGMSYVLIDLFFQTLVQEGIINRLVLISAYAAVFLVTPVYLLGQTIPLISNYFSKEALSKITGKMLFLSTLGSFVGAVFSTLVLMNWIGVHYTVVVNFIVLAVLVTLLSKDRTSKSVTTAWALALIGIVLNSNAIMQGFGIVENNAYNTIAIREFDGERHMVLNNNDSSMMADDGRRHEYIEFIEHVGIMPIWKADPPKNILVIGAGAFTIGYPDHNSLYDFVDIDESLKATAEEYILKSKLTDNKIFHPVPARSFLRQTNKKYDLIILDAYLGSLSMPEHLATQEFFMQVKNVLKEDGAVMANFISSSNFASPFSRHIDDTFRSVFPHISRHIIGKNYGLWSKDTRSNANIVYIYKNHPDIKPERTIYTDDRNPLFLDKPQNILR